ncbi:MAG TPA: hypothetical protein VHZ96_20855 [Frankiaceae bacterium]|nr:hypothetical protein [Frankiaceae bacterium]
METAYADPVADARSMAELSWADWPTEEFAVPFRQPLPRRRRRVPVAVLATLMLLIGLAAGLGAALAVRGAADPSAAPRAGASPKAAPTPSPTSYDVSGTLTAVEATSISVSTGSVTATYRVTSATRITRSAVVIRLQTLKVGEQVTVRLGFANSTSRVLVARAITVKAAPKASAAATSSPAQASAAPQPAVVTPSPQAVVPAPATVVAPTRGIGYGAGVGGGVVQPRSFGGR